MRISDWSSDVCSSDLAGRGSDPVVTEQQQGEVPAEPVRQKIPLRQMTVDEGHAGARAFPEGGIVGIRRCIIGKGRGLARIDEQIGRASCRERVCQYVEISVVAVALKKKIRIHQ